jgi:hypothetical protein
MKVISTKDKLSVLKEVFAESFMLATTESISQGLQFKYKSTAIEHEEQRGWTVEIMVKEAGYPERIIQVFAYNRPDNIDTYRMEYEALLNVMSSIVQTSLITWYEAAKYLATDKELQKEIIKDLKEQ